MSTKLKDSDPGSWNSFICLCERIGSISSRNSKTSLIKEFVSDFDGNLLVFLELILPKVTGRTYQMNKKRMTKLFSSIFNQTVSFIDSQMTNGPNAGMIGKVISSCYASSNAVFPQKHKASKLSMLEVNDALNALTSETKEQRQSELLKRVVSKCNVKDLQWFVLCIDRDLKIDAGTKTVLDGIGERAYETFQSKASLEYIVNAVTNGSSLSNDGADTMMPLKPMLAAPCKNYKVAFDKCKR